MYGVIAFVALLAAMLTFFSGFGLGTLLLPAFALFMPLDAAVAATAVVHLSNNLFKIMLIGRHVHTPTLVRFGVPAVIAAGLGAAVLWALAGLDAIHSYSLGERRHDITVVKLVLALIIGVFAALELSPRFERWTVPRRWLPLGGLLSGFFGGLSGHQGALRAAFLMRVGLTKDQFIATGVAAAVIVDLVRLVVYALSSAAWTHFEAGAAGPGVIVTGCIAAFAGSMVGAALLRKTTLTGVRRTVAALLILLALALTSGLV